MVQHMVLAMVAPIFLALGAPSRSPCARCRRAARGLLAVLHSRAAGVLTFPLVAFVLFVAHPVRAVLHRLYQATLRNRCCTS